MTYRSQWNGFSNEVSKEGEQHCGCFLQNLVGMRYNRVTSEPIGSDKRTFAWLLSDAVQVHANVDQPAYFALLCVVVLCQSVDDDDRYSESISRISLKAFPELLSGSLGVSGTKIMQQPFYNFWVNERATSSSWCRETLAGPDAGLQGESRMQERR